MAVAFTAIVNGTDLQSVSFVNEIVLAFRERYQAAYEQTSPPLFAPLFEAGDDWQKASFWARLQEETDTMVGPQLWLDHTQTIQGGNDFFPYAQYIDRRWHLNDWRNKAGLYYEGDPVKMGEGYRRAVDYPDNWVDPHDPAYLHGLMQPGDIIGPWIFQDLQNALDSLRHNRANIVYTSEQSTITEVAGTSKSKWLEEIYVGTNICGASRTQHIANWTDHTVAATGAAYQVSAQIAHYQEAGVWKWRMSSYRLWGGLLAINAATHVPSTVDWYGQCHYDTPEDNLDGLPDLPPSGTLYRFGRDDGPSQAGPIRVSSKGMPMIAEFEPNTTAPLALSDIDCGDFTPGVAGSSRRGFNIRSSSPFIQAVSKWHFTNMNP